MVYHGVQRYYIARYCTLMHGIARYCTLLHGIAHYCMVLHVIEWCSLHVIAIPTTLCSVFLPDCILADDCLRLAAFLLKYNAVFSFLLRYNAVFSCFSALVYWCRWPESLSGESNRRADSKCQTPRVSAEVSNGLADTPPPSLHKVF